MGMFNYLRFEAKCPFCKEFVQFEAEMRIGYLNLDEYKIGDKVRWNNSNHKIKPKNRNLVAEGYVECSKCNKDFWIDIIVKEDIISAINVSDKKGYIE